MNIHLSVVQEEGGLYKNVVGFLRHTFTIQGLCWSTALFLLGKCSEDRHAYETQEKCFFFKTVTFSYWSSTTHIIVEKKNYNPAYRLDWSESPRCQLPGEENENNPLANTPEKSTMQKWQTVLERGTLTYNNTKVKKASRVYFRYNSSNA